MSIKKLTGNHFRRLLAAPFRRFSRNQDGTTAVEFGIVALPFLALLFAIIETALVFFTGQALESAATDSARLIFTGQAQNGGLNQATFKQAVCSKINGLLDCEKGVYVDVRTFTNFTSVSFDSPVDGNGGLVDNFGYKPGGPGDIVVVRLLYQFPVYMQLWNPNLVNMAGNKRLLVATAAFRNEPF